jgi:glycosyltransferase involved in cell wall biosynthesis
MEHSLPILAATDKNTDLGKVITEGEFGFWCQNGDLDRFNSYIDRLCEDEGLRSSMGEKAHQYLLERYTVSKSAATILNHFSKGV